MRLSDRMRLGAGPKTVLQLVRLHLRQLVIVELGELRLHIADDLREAVQVLSFAHLFLDWVRQDVVEHRLQVGIGDICAKALSSDEPLPDIALKLVHLGALWEHVEVADAAQDDLFRASFVLPGRTLYSSSPFPSSPLASCTRRP